MATAPQPLAERRRPPPRVWVPGLLWLSRSGEICAGPDVGFDDDGIPPRALPWPLHRRIEEWTHAAWLVERRVLRPALVTEHAIILPESLVDRDELPHAHRWLSEQPLVCVAGHKAERLARAGLRVYFCAHDTAVDDSFRVTIWRGEEAQVELRAPREALRGWGEAAGPALRLVSADLTATLADRTLRSLSDGVLTEAAVVHALASRSLVEKGYGYHGAESGEYRLVDDIAEDARPLDQLFGQVYERARGQLDDARAIPRALPRGPVDADELELPVLGRAERVTLKAATIEARDGTGVQLRVGGKEQGALELPALDRWFVPEMAPWRPTASWKPSAHHGDDGAPLPSRGLKLAAACVLAALAVVIGVIAWSSCGQ